MTADTFSDHHIEMAILVYGLNHERPLIDAGLPYGSDDEVSQVAEEMGIPLDQLRAYLQRQREKIEQEQRDEEAEWSYRAEQMAQDIFHEALLKRVEKLGVPVGRGVPRYWVMGEEVVSRQGDGVFRIKLDNRMVYAEGDVHLPTDWASEWPALPSDVTETVSIDRFDLRGFSIYTRIHHIVNK